MEWLCGGVLPLTVAAEFPATTGVKYQTCERVSLEMAAAPACMSAPAQILPAGALDVMEQLTLLI